MSFARTGFKRPQIERSPRSPLRRMENQRGVIRPIGDEVRAVPKTMIHRSEAYRRFVASQECFGCRITSFSQCAHLNERKGLSLKTCDSLTFPLCAPHHGEVGCHQQYDLGLDGMVRAERRVWARVHVDHMRARAMEAGWRFTDEGILKP
jgi:hypothetical protein